MYLLCIAFKDVLLLCNVCVGVLPECMFTTCVPHASHGARAWQCGREEVIESLGTGVTDVHELRGFWELNPAVLQEQTSALNLRASL